MKNIKYWIFRNLYSSDLPDNRSISIVEASILSLIVLNVIAIVIASFPDLTKQQQFFFSLFEVVSVILFTLEYFLRIWVADLSYPHFRGTRARIRFISSPNGIIDLLAVLPFYLPFFIIMDLRFLRIMRLLRIVRVFKLNRYSRSMQLIGDVLKEIRNDLIITFSVCLLLLMVASTIMFYVEHHAQPDRFTNILDSFWWAVATLTTIGYGDIYPITGWGRFISGIIALLGIALLALPTGILSSAFIDRINESKTANRRTSAFCPHCGKALHVMIIGLFISLTSSGCKNEEMEMIRGFVPSENTIPEGDENVDFPVSFSSTGSKPDAIVEFELVEGTARFGSDLGLTSGSIEIEGGEGVIQVPIIGDTHLELSESFSIRMIVEDREFLYDFTIADDDEPGTILSDNDGFYTPDTYPSMELQWRDEFESEMLDENNWSYEIGDGCDRDLCGWGNNELQSYTSDNENVRVEDGNLIIEATEIGSDNYRSARIITQDKVERQFGRIDVRARMPKGQGIWPAIWMLGANIDEVGWPVCGEIDIMELVGHEPNVTHGTIHYDNGTVYTSSTGSRSLLGTDFSEKFHVFSLLWDRDEISWYLDNEKFKSFSKREGESYPFNSAFFFILNVAVGGNWPGDPDETTVFPVRMEVDYLRVFR